MKTTTQASPLAVGDLCAYNGALLVLVAPSSAREPNALFIDIMVGLEREFSADFVAAHFARVKPRHCGQRFLARQCARGQMHQDAADFRRQTQFGRLASQPQATPDTTGRGFLFKPGRFRLTLYIHRP